MKNLLLILIVAAGGYWGYQRFYVNKTDAPAETVAPKDDAAEFKAAVQRSQQRAVKAHPELAKLNSPFNSRFVNIFKLWRAHNDARLNQPNWPEVLANNVTAQPAVISVKLDNGKELHFETLEQRDAYLAAMNRAQKNAVAPTSPAKLASSRNSLSTGTGLSTEKLHTSR